MENRKFVLVLAFFAVAGLVLLTGCPKNTELDDEGHTEKVTESSSMSGDPNEPEWVRRGGAGLNKETDKFYGVGICQGIKNRALQKQTADSRARAELARVLDTYVANFMKDYMSSALETGMDEPQEEQFVSSITKSVTEATLVGSQIVDHYRGPDGTLYALAEVSFDSLAKMMRQEMKKKADELEMDADEALDELDKELEKRDQR